MLKCGIKKRIRNRIIECSAPPQNSAKKTNLCLGIAPRTLSPKGTFSLCNFKQSKIEPETCYTKQIQPEVCLGAANFHFSFCPCATVLLEVEVVEEVLLQGEMLLGAPY